VHLYGWVGVGLGATGLATSAITGIVALDRKSYLDGVCRPGCPPSAAGDIDTFRTYRTLSYLGFIVGTVSLAAGSYLLVHDAGDGQQVGLTVGPAAASFSGAF
jgi:hypothetical protein